jgi:hypothetical protein
MHLEAVQRANRIYDGGEGPDMLLHPNDRWYDFRSVINRVFAAKDRQKSLQIIDDHANIWERVIGTRGYTGKRAVNAHTMFNNLFEVDNSSDADDELNPELLEALEGSV